MADQERVVERTVRVEQGESQTGWVVAVLVLIVVIIGGVYMWMHYRHPAAAPAPQSDSTNINVTLPGGTNNTGDPSAAGAAQ